MLAMNDDAVFLTDRGVSIASKPAPTGSNAAQFFVGAGLPAMNDNAVFLTDRGV